MYHCRRAVGRTIIAVIRTYAEHAGAAGTMVKIVTSLFGRVCSTCTFSRRCPDYNLRAKSINTRAHHRYPIGQQIMVENDRNYNSINERASRCAFCIIGLNRDSYIGACRCVLYDDGIIRRPSGQPRGACCYAAVGDADPHAR